MTRTERVTRQRLAVRRALESTPGFRSAQELHAEIVRGDARVGLTTVYRTLQQLVHAGEIDAVRREDGEIVYRRCESERHHHHLVCRDCGVTVELASDEIERWASANARAHGFRDVTHTAELYGTCSSCSA